MNSSDFKQAGFVERLNNLIHHKQESHTGRNVALGGLAAGAGVGAGAVGATGLLLRSLLKKSLAGAGGAGAAHPLIDAATGQVLKHAGALGAIGKGLGRLGSFVGKHIPTGVAAAQAAQNAGKNFASQAGARAGQAIGGLSQRVGTAVGGMEPGLGRRLLGGSQHASSSPLNPSELGQSVLKRVGGTALGAGAVGGSYLKGEADAAAEAKRRASQMGFMQRLAFLMNPGMVNRM